jgi:hypothetical protein
MKGGASPTFFSHRGVGTGPYGFRLVERAYSSERPEAAFPQFRIPLPPINRPLLKKHFITDI